MPDREEKKITLLNRRLRWSMGRTISMGKGTFEFTRLDVGEEADIPDGVDVAAGFTALIKDVVRQIAIAETAIRGGENPLAMPQEESLYENDETVPE